MTKRTAEAKRSELERDALLEVRYRYDREYQPSTLAFVAANLAELVSEFAGWVQAAEGRAMDRRSQREWEMLRFGAQLHESAHAVLLAGVEASIRSRQARCFGPFSSEAERKRILDQIAATPWRPGDPKTRYLRGVCTLAGLVPPVGEPATPKTGEETNDHGTRLRTGQNGIGQAGAGAAQRVAVAGSELPARVPRAAAGDRAPHQRATPIGAERERDPACIGERDGEHSVPRGTGPGREAGSAGEPDLSSSEDELL